MIGLATASALAVLTLLTTRGPVLQVSIMSEGKSRFKMFTQGSRHNLLRTNATNSLIRTNTITQCQATMQRDRMSRGHLSPADDEAIPPRRWAASQAPQNGLEGLLSATSTCTEILWRTSTPFPYDPLNIEPTERKPLGHEPPDRDPEVWHHPEPCTARILGKEAPPRHRPLSLCRDDIDRPLRRTQ